MVRALTVEDYSSSFGLGQGEWGGLEMKLEVTVVLLSGHEGLGAGEGRAGGMGRHTPHSEDLGLREKVLDLSTLLERFLLPAWLGGRKGQHWLAGPGGKSMLGDDRTLTSWFRLWQVPRTSEIYVHRSGRTARATNEGLSLMLIGPEDVINFKKIYKTLKKDEDIPLFPVQTKYMDAVKVKIKVKNPVLMREGIMLCPHLAVRLWQETPPKQ